MNEELLLILSTILFLSGMAVVAWMHSQYHMDVVVSPETQLLPGEDGKLPQVDVIVPARNEARNIRRCVEALLGQSYLNYTLTVVNDRSTDATPAILEELQRGAQQQPGGPEVRVIQGEDLPPGWAGKPHALMQGAQVTSGDWLCFVDADTFARPQLLGATLAAAERQRADLFSILTQQILVTFWEKTILPLVFTALSVGFPAARVNDPNRPEAIANGQFILIRKQVYDAVGGHQAVKKQIAEDKALAELVKRRGYRLVIADGRAVAATRMYTSFAEIWEGWTKNIFLGMQGRLGLLLFGALVGLVGSLLLPVWLAGSLAWLAAGGGLPAAVVTGQAVLLWAYLLWVRSMAARAFGISPWYALTTPLGALAFTGMMFHSAFKVLSGQGVRWKGRSYRM